MRLICRNQVSDDVASIQETLNLLMFPPHNNYSVPTEALKVDRFFGPKTEARIKEFQRLRNIKDDGIIGPVTKWHLFPFILYRGHANASARKEIRLKRDAYAPKLAMAARAGGLLAQVGNPMKPVPNLFPPIPPIGPKQTPGSGGGGLTLPQFVSVDLLAGQKLQLAPLPPLGAEDARIRSLFFEFSFTMVRHEHWEVALNLELSRKMPNRANDRWEVDGAAQLSVASRFPSSMSESS